MKDHPLLQRYRKLPPKQQRLVFISFSLALFMIAVQLVLGAFRDNIVFFYTPSELVAVEKQNIGRTMRVGGLVKQHSLSQDAAGTLHFTLTDGSGEIKVAFRGMPPALFREGQGVVAEGTVKNDGSFAAASLLAKHDERYMPPEVIKRLKQSGYWRGNPAQPHPP